MTNQSTVPHTEIGLRLTICSEYLLDEQKPVEELYRSWMRRIGGQLIGFTEFEYWYRRFKNNQFNLGHDTSQDSKESSEIQNTVVPEASGKKDVSTMTMEKEAPVTVVKMAKQHFKLDLQLKEKTVPQVLQTHGENAILGVPDAIETVNDDRSGSSNDADKENIDLNYDTSSDSKEISKNQNTIDPEASEIKNDSAVIMKKEAPVETVKRKTEELKLNYQFNEKDVPQTFRALINRQFKKTICIQVRFREQCCTIALDKMRVRMKKRRNDWIIWYKHTIERFTTDAPEKSIIDHLWFVLRNPSIKLEDFRIRDYTNPEWKLKTHHTQKFDFEKLNAVLQSMFNKFDHQINITGLSCGRFNEEMCLTLLQNVKPGTLERIYLEILWEEKGSDQKLREIVELDQWKQAKVISSFGVTPLKIDDLLHCQCFQLQRDRITPEDVLRVVEGCFNAVGRKSCYLSSKNESLDIEAIMDVLRSQNDGSKITETKPISSLERFSFKIVKSVKFVELKGSESSITIQNYSGF